MNSLHLASQSHPTWGFKTTPNSLTWEGCNPASCFSPLLPNSHPAHSTGKLPPLPTHRQYQSPQPWASHPRAPDSAQRRLSARLPSWEVLKQQSPAESSSLTHRTLVSTRLSWHPAPCFLLLREGESPCCQPSSLNSHPPSARPPGPCSGTQNSLR